MNKEVEGLRHENKRLMERLNQKGRPQSDSSEEPEARRSYQYGGSRLSVSAAEDGFQSISVSPSRGRCGLHVGRRGLHERSTISGVTH